ncbi:hypothetical protein HK105_201200 [Polyrhizophydium stewartii]|uniref:Palmitoyltransferase n=1 Tax=Polyrhizophydium stewartii TaxID=2732419 RepID=A0ABR4NJ45_9FUNG
MQPAALRAVAATWAAGWLGLTALLGVALMRSDPADRGALGRASTAAPAISTAPANAACVGDGLEDGTPTQFCLVCEAHVRIDSLHCRYCNKCVRRIDHHCFYVNNCIGYHNYRLYLLTMGSTFVCAANTACLSVAALAAIFLDPDYESRMEAATGLTRTTLRTINAVDALLSLTVTAYLLYLLLLHAYLVANGLTTLQYSHNKRERRRAGQLAAEAASADGAHRSASCFPPRMQVGHNRMRPQSARKAS